MLCFLMFCPTFTSFAPAIKASHSITPFSYNTKITFPINMFTTLAPILFLLLFKSLNAAPFLTDIQAPSGRLIPQSLLRTNFPDLPVHDLHKRLYEVTSDLKLISYTSVVELKTHVGEPKKISNSNSLVFINGQPSYQRPTGFIREGGGYSIVTREDGTVLSLKTPEKIFKPVSLAFYPGLFVSIHSEDTIDFGDDEEEVPVVADSGVGSGDIEVANAEPSCRGADAPPQYVELAVAIDSALCAKYASAADAELAVRGVINSGEAVYSAKMCIRFQINVIDIRCNPSTDPYASIVDPLDGFREIWGTLPVSSVQRDAVLYVTGTNFLSGVAGQAYVGVTCLQAFSFMWIDLLSGLIFAHEMGHNLNASHVDTGVMKASISLRTDNFFSDESVDTIVAFVDAETSRSICIEGVAAPPSPTSTATPTSTPTPSLAQTITSLPSTSSTSSSTATPSTIPSLTESPAASSTPSESSLPTPSVSPTESTPASPSSTSEPSVSNSVQPSSSSSVSPDVSATSSAIPSVSPSTTATVSASNSVAASVSSSPTSSPLPSETPSTSLAPSPTATTSKVSTPSPTTSLPGDGTCDSLLLQRQSYSCGNSGGVYKVDVPVSYEGLSATMTLNTFIEQSFGFAFDVKAPKFVMFGEKKNKEKVTVTVTNVQILASFSTITQSEVSSVTSTVTSQGSSVIGYFYPGELVPPPGTSSCCNSELTVAALITIELDGSASSIEIKVFVSRKVLLRCVQYNECLLGFERMSESVKCPICEN